MASRTVTTLRRAALGALAATLLGAGGCLHDPWHHGEAGDAGERAQERIIEAVHEAGVTAVAFSRDGSLLASASADGAVILWDIEAGAARRRISGQPGGATAVAFSPDGTELATAGTAGEVRLWDPGSGRELATLTGPGSPIHALAFSPDGARLAAGGEGPEVWLWRMEGDEPPQTFAGPGAVASLAFSPNGRFLYLGPTASEAEGIRRLDLADGSSRTGLPPDGPVLHDLPLRPLLAMPDAADSPGDARLAWADGETVLLGDPISSRIDKRLLGHFEDVTSLAASPDGRFLASGAFDKTVVLWDLATGKELRTLYGHALQVRALAFSPDGRLLASGSTDRTVRLWEVETGRLSATFGRLLASATEMWEVEVLSTRRTSEIESWFRRWSLNDPDEEFLLVEARVTNRLSEPNILYGSSLSVTDGRASYPVVGLEPVGIVDGNRFIRLYQDAGAASTETFIFVVPAGENELALRLLDLPAVTVG